MINYRVSYVFDLKFLNICQEFLEEKPERWKTENEIKLEVPPIRFHSWTTEVPIQQRGGKKMEKKKLSNISYKKTFSDLTG